MIRIVWEPFPRVVGTVDAVPAERAAIQHGSLCPDCGARAVTPDGRASTCRACGWTTQAGR